MHLVLLSNPVSSCLSLKVVLRIPVAVKNDDGVGRRKVHSKTSGTSWQQETEILHLELCTYLINDIQ